VYFFGEFFPKFCNDSNYGGCVKLGVAHQVYFELMTMGIKLIDCKGGIRKDSYDNRKIILSFPLQEKLA
jgi:hypothetical protein